MWYKLKWWLEDNWWQIIAVAYYLFVIWAVLYIGNSVGNSESFKTWSKQPASDISKGDLLIFICIFAALFNLSNKSKTR